MVGAEISAESGSQELTGLRAPSGSAALTHRFEQADAGGDRHVQRRDGTGHRDADQLVAVFAVRRRMPSPSAPITSAIGPVILL